MTQSDTRGFDRIRSAFSSLISQTNADDVMTENNRRTALRALTCHLIAAVIYSAVPMILYFKYDSVDDVKQAEFFAVLLIHALIWSQIAAIAFRWSRNRGHVMVKTAVIVAGTTIVSIPLYLMSLQFQSADANTESIWRQAFDLTMISVLIACSVIFAVVMIVGTLFALVGLLNECLFFDESTVVGETKSLLTLDTDLVKPAATTATTTAATAATDTAEMRVNVETAEHHYDKV
jgi:hypothetical protein